MVNGNWYALMVIPTVYFGRNPLKIKAITEVTSSVLPCTNLTQILLHGMGLKHTLRSNDHICFTRLEKFYFEHSLLYICIFFISTLENV